MRDREKKLTIWLIILILAINFTFDIPQNVSADLIDESALVIRSPISIIGNSQFTSANGVTAGNGTKDNPYLIRNWSIDSTNSHGIYIFGTTAYFVIENCYLFNGLNQSNMYTGISITSASNGTLKNNRITTCNRGLKIFDSSGFTVFNNTIYNNTINLFFRGFADSHFNHTISTNNTLDGKPIYYWKNKSNLTVPSNAGFVGLVYCTNITVKNLNITRNHPGVILYSTINSSIYNNTMSYGGEGQIYTDSSSNISIYNNKIYNVTSSVILRKAQFNSIYNNTIFNSVNGINIAHSNNCTISNNSISHNSIRGIYLFGSRDIIIHYNLVFDNFQVGIYSQKSLVEYNRDNTIFNNLFYNNRKGLFLRDFINGTISYNKLFNNSYTGIGSDENFKKNIVFNNTLLNNDKGIRISLAEDNHIYNNSITNGSHGLRIESNSNRNLIYNNTIAVNVYGLSFSGQIEYNTINHNMILNNSIGINITSQTSNNIIYDNYFSNSINYISSSSNNFWNISKTSGKNILNDPYLGGNYWSDYNGSDLDYDGIGDTDLPHGPGDLLPIVTYVIPPKTLIVDDNGDGDFTKIQPAINYANNKDTILVWKGTYQENIVVNKTVTIIGNGTVNTTIDGSAIGDVVLITSNYVNLTGFHVNNSGTGGSSAGIKLQNVQKCYLNDNNISQNEYGIYSTGSLSNTFQNNTFYSNIVNGIHLTGSSHYNTILYNNITKNDHGIYIENSWGINIQNNTVTDNFNRGIFIDRSSNHIIKNNNISKNKGGIYLRSYFSQPDLTRNNKIIENKIISNTGYGVYLYFARNNFIEGNKIAYNTMDGIFVYETSNGNEIISNNVSFNAGSGIELYTASNSIITTNYVTNNSINGVHIHTGSDNNQINSNEINNNSVYGLYISSASNYNEIYCNNINYNLISGIYLSSNLNTISNNNASFNDNYGMHLNTALYNKILNNSVLFNNWSGIYNYYGLDLSNWNTINNNTLSWNNEYGLYQIMASDNTIENNTASYNKAGFYFYFSHRNKVNNNLIYSNSNYGVYCWKSKDNVFQNITSENNSYGFYFEFTSTRNKINKSIITENIEGLHTRQDSDFEIHYSRLYNNSGYGVRNIDPSKLVNATLNWWGSSDGPYHPTKNSIGTGDNVSDYVLFEPYFNDLGIVIQTVDITSIYEDQEYQVKYEIIKIEDKILNWTYISNASWLKFGPINNTIFGTPTNVDIGIYYVMINITDDKGNFIERNFTLEAINIPPEILTADLKNAIEEQSYYNDYNSDDDGFGNISWNMATNSKFLSIDKTTGELSGFPLNDDVGSYWVNISVEDGNGGIGFSNFTLTVMNTNDPPTLFPDDVLTILEDDYYEVAYGIIDMDIGDTYTWTFSTNATSWLSWDTLDNRLYGTPRNEHIGQYWVIINVTDNNGGYDEHDFTLKVINVNDPPVITTTDTTSVEEDQYYEVQYDAMDVDPGDVITWKQSTNANWLKWGQQNHTLYGTPRNNDVGTYWVSINVSDNIGDFDLHYFILVVNNTNDRPSIITTDKSSTFEDEPYEVVYQASDIDIGDTINWVFESSADWMNWGDVNHTLYGNPQNDDVGTYPVRISISDGNGGFDEHVFDLEVINVNDPPVIAGVLSELTVNAYEDTKLDLTENISDVDNDRSELVLNTNSDHATVTGFIITFNYPNEVKTESVEITVTEGTDLSVPHVITITVIPKDLTSPSIIENLPQGKNVPVSTNIKITFDEPMIISSVENAFSISNDAVGKFYWNENTVTFDPDTDLLHNTTYYITIEASAKDLAENRLLEIVYWDFVTVVKKLSVIDTDNDGHPDNIDEFPEDPSEWMDTDDDDQGDNKDPDDDNDGISDSDELILGTDPLLKDSDNDGHDDSEDAYPLDSTKWEKKTSEPEEKSNMGIIAGTIVIIIVVLILLFMFFIKPRMGIKAPPPEEKKEEIKKP